jgi:hypothetical protein
MVDASVFNDQASDQITVRLRRADPTAALATIRTRHPRPQDSPG